MSSLRKITNPRPELTVQVSAVESFTVRGVGFNDILAIYYRHSGTLATAFETLILEYQTLGEVDASTVTTLIAKAVGDFPVLVAEVIAVASGSDITNDQEFYEEVEIARQLSAGVQMGALEKILALTFTSEMPPKKLFALLVQNLGLNQMKQGALTT